MNKKVLIGAGIVVVVGLTLLIAATFEVTVPPGNATANAAARCDEVRINERIRTDAWDNNACANVMTWAGVKTATEEAAAAAKSASLATCQSDANNIYQTTMNNFEIDWPFPATRSSCGDSQIDTEFGEDCDDGGESATCNEDCTNAVCGDGKLNVTAGEQCDDGNTDNGDGCDSACQEEIAQIDLPTDVHLAWDPVLDAEGYRVYFSDITGQYDNPILETVETTAVIDSLDPCDHWFAVVKAFNEVDESPPSNEIEFIVDEEDCEIA
jgi:cysteine-rich repeat protein